MLIFSFFWIVIFVGVTDDYHNFVTVQIVCFKYNLKCKTVCCFYFEAAAIGLSSMGAVLREDLPFLKGLGAVSIRKTVLPGMAIPMLKIRRPNGRLIFNMEIAIRR